MNDWYKPIKNLNLCAILNIMLIQTVALKDVKCFALHGYYPEEQLIGHDFLVNVEVVFIPSTDTENIDKTVNYEVLNDIILLQMKNTQKMLETVVKNMLDNILDKYSFLQEATVSIKKNHPAMPGDVHQSFVQLQYKAD